jgi:hypothetical protein
MSVVQAKTMPYGPAKIDIQIEQGADFILPLEVQAEAAPVDLTGATLEAGMSAQWSPGAAPIPLVITPVDLSLGLINVTFPSAESASLVLPFPPRKTVAPQKFELGGWILHITKDGVTFRYCEGQVFLDRMPWLT